MPKHKAYYRTQVDPLKSISEIKEMLNKRGIFSITHKEGFDPLDQKYKTMLGFSLLEKIEGEWRETPIGFIISLDHKPSDGNKFKQEHASIYRVLLNHVKQVFVSIDYGLLDLEEAFMPHIMTRGADGQLTTMYQHWLPLYRKALEDGSFKDVPVLPEIPKKTPEEDEERRFREATIIELGGDHDETR